MAKRKINVMVLMGGPSAEHEVSLHTGEQILAHLDVARYIATPVIISKKGEWLMGRDDKWEKLSRADILSAIAKNGDVAFIALHGAFGEDGTVQGLLESFDIPYTGSGVLASALGMDKPRSLSVLRDTGFTVPPFYVLSASDTPSSSKKKIMEIIRTLGFSLVIKPSDHGSSIGVSIVRKSGDMARAVALAEKYSPDVIIQKFIQGREVTCGVLEKGKHIVTLPPVEIVPKGKFYDYKSKYADGGSDHLIPPPNMPPKIIETIQDAARQAHRVIGCSGMSRTDFILGDDGKCYVLEINTIPGMTSTSLLPQSAAHIGITFPKLLDILITNALGK